jgi:hypothetical protein
MTAFTLGQVDRHGGSALVYVFVPMRQHSRSHYQVPWAMGDDGFVLFLLFPHFWGVDAWWGIWNVTLETESEETRLTPGCILT